MYRMRKTFLHRFLQVTLISALVLVSATNFGLVHAATDVPSVISADTTWTKEDSPYNIKGPVLINTGVTVTIEPGATVNLNDYYIQVDGTLNARGSSADQIHFNGGIIRFTESSSDWNEQTGTGCIIENADLSSTRIEAGNAPKISSNSIYEIIVDGAATITENTILGSVNIGGSATVSHNFITNSAPGSVSVSGGSPTISHNLINCRVMVSGGSPTISDNAIHDGVHVDSRGGHPLIVDNSINIRGDYYEVFVGVPSATISGNTIVGNGNNRGVYFGGDDEFVISGNNISNCVTAIEGHKMGPSTIEGNFVKNNDNGISISVFSSVYSPFEDSGLTIKNNVITDNLGVGIDLNHPSATIINNTIANNQVGIQISELEGYAQSQTIRDNNIYANGYNIKSQMPHNIDATYNWWGTTDTSAINQTIYDFKYDFNVGTIQFVPFLTEENTEIPEFPSWTILPLVLAATLAAATLRKKLTK